MFGDVALDREVLIVALARCLAEFRVRVLELVQLEGREHFRGARVVAHNGEFLQHTKMFRRKCRSRCRSFHLRDLRRKLRWSAPID